MVVAHREVLEKMICSRVSLQGSNPGLGIEQLDASDLRALCLELLAANPQIVQDVRERQRKGRRSVDRASEKA